MISLSATALLVVDVQMAFVERDTSGVLRSTPSAEDNIHRLLEHFRQGDGCVIHVHHHSLDKDSAFCKDKPGSRVQEFAAPSDHETVYVKHVNSAFIGTDLEKDLRQKSMENLVVCGGTANHCVETTTRMAGNLGFNVFYVSDAVWAYGGTGPDGRVHTPEGVLSMSLFNLDEEFATVTTTDWIVREVV